jgi:predicted nucleotidyltransferase
MVAESRTIVPETTVFKTEAVTADVLRHVVQRIVEALGPERIILYGSRARGEQTVDSDLDLLVVMETAESKFHRGALVSDLVSPRFFSMDMAVYTPDEFRRAATHEDPYFDPFLREVLEDGVILYERPAH